MGLRRTSWALPWLAKTRKSIDVLALDTMDLRTWWAMPSLAKMRKSMNVLALDKMGLRTSWALPWLAKMSKKKRKRREMEIFYSHLDSWRQIWIFFKPSRSFLAPVVDYISEKKKKRWIYRGVETLLLRSAFGSEIGRCEWQLMMRIMRLKMNNDPMSYNLIIWDLYFYLTRQYQSRVGGQGQWLQGRGNNWHLLSYKL